MVQKKIGYLAAILKLCNIPPPPELWVFNSAYIYGANFIANSSGKVVFLKGIPRKPPSLLGVNESKSTLVT